MRDPHVLRTLLLLDLESHPPPAAIDVVTLELDPAPARIVQYSLLERAMPSAETLATLTARLGALVGETRCGSPALLDSHRPDGFTMRRFAPDARAAGIVRAGGGPDPGGGCRPPGPAPLPAARRGPRPGGARPSGRGRDRSPRHARRRRRPSRPGRGARPAPGGTRGGRRGTATNGTSRSATARSAACSGIARAIAGLSTACSIECPRGNGPCTSNSTPPPRSPFSTVRRCPKRSSSAPRRSAIRRWRCSIATASTARRAFIWPPGAPASARSSAPS